MNLIAVQLDIAWEDKPANFAAVRRLLASEAVDPGDLVVLPEMFATGFSMNAAAVAEPAGGPAHAFAADLAAAHGCFVLAGVATRGADGRARNEAVLFNPDGEPTARYAKRHPFTFAGEADHYTAGDELVLFAWGGFTVAPLICYDLRFPEAFRAAVGRGANLFVVPANWPAGRRGHWSTLLAARAIENQAYVLGVNRCGADPQHAYAGGSVLIDPRGEAVVAAGAEECVLRAAPDLEGLLDYRRAFPVLADRREG